MSEFDLNLDNYNLKDLLNLFKIKINFDEDDLKRAKIVALKTHPDKSGLDNEIFDFFFKAYKMIEKIYYFKKKKMGKVYDVEYTEIDTDNITDGDKELLNKLNNKSVKDFNKWFNNMFEKVKMKEGLNNEGYGEWFKSGDDISNEKAKSMNDFGRIFNKKKEETRALVLKKDIEDMRDNVNSGYNLDRNNKVEYSSGIFSNKSLKYDDLKRAHTETVVPVTREDYENRPKYRNVNHFKTARENQDVNPLSKKDSMILLNKKERKNDEIATNLAYDLLKQEQEAEERKKIWWKNLRQLKN
tara:strand:+ start:7868 stop:8764 length:897 start_codon:yes stop_codon:yes gene_type:complete